jgi:2-iminoacetate synthase
MEHYLDKDRTFINEEKIFESLAGNERPGPERIRDILEKSLSIQTLEPDETAALLNTEDPDDWEKIFYTAGEIKKKVYDNRIVTFAPLYLSNFCVNSCLYCAFRKENRVEKRRRLNLEEVKKETEILAGEIGHKRLIVVYGEHPLSNIDYMVDTIRAIYSVKVKTRNGYGSIRRVNVNAPSLSIGELKRLKEIGIGTYQVFQETYHRKTYEDVHPRGTRKHDYRWRLYCMHRSQEAGVDDVGIGVLFGLYDWKFEVMGLLYHARELERRFGVGPHTISFPRLQPAANTPFIQESKYKVSDGDFKKLIAVLRLSVPYTGMILTAREPAQIRRQTIPIGTTQTDASTRIGIGAYSDRYIAQEAEKQQFLLGDTRTLDELIGELAGMGYITSFCTAGYRCGRTGKKIMGLLKSGREGWFCKLNAILTFREWLDDFAGRETKLAGERLIAKEIEEVKKKSDIDHSRLMQYYWRLENGERDLYF